MRTFSAKPKDVTRQWYVIDAAKAPLGRVSSLAAIYLIGKHKPQYTTHIDVGDAVIIINAAKLKLTGTKLDKKLYYRHSGHPGNLKTATAKEMIAKNPANVIELAVRGMLPKNKLQAIRLARLKIYAESEHDQTAQKPIELEVSHAN